jgi:hypothetical protein
MGIELKVDVTGGALKKLIEVVASGIGAVARPWLLKRDARAQVDAELIRQVGESSQRKAMLAGPTVAGDALVLQEEAIPLLPARVKQRLEYQEAKRQVNIEDVAIEARVDLEENSNVSDEPVDDDWTARFFSHVQDISAERMKKLWGRLLAGEIRKPGSFSLRCLETLKNLSREEAVLFERVAPCVVGDSALHIRGQAPFGLNMYEQLVLADAGLLHPTPLGWTVNSRELDRFEEMISFHDVAIRVRRDSIEPQFQLHSYKLTDVGSELIRLFKCGAHRERLKWLCDPLRSAGFTVSLHPITAREGNGYRWDPSSTVDE